MWRERHYHEGMTLIRIALLTLLVGCVPHARWTRTEIGMEVVSTVVQVADWRQTNQIVTDCREGDPVIGACGDRVPPAVFFPVSAVLRFAVAEVLPHAWRVAWIAAYTGYQVGAVETNTQAGYAWWK